MGDRGFGSPTQSQGEAAYIVRQTLMSLVFTPISYAQRTYICLPLESVLGCSVASPGHANSRTRMASLRSSTLYCSVPKRPGAASIKRSSVSQHRVGLIRAAAPYHPEPEARCQTQPLPGSTGRVTAPEAIQQSSRRRLMGAALLAAMAAPAPAALAWGTGFPVRIAASVPHRCHSFLLECSPSPA